MLYIKFLDSFNLTKSGNLCVNTVEIAACSELALPEESSSSPAISLFA